MQNETLYRCVQAACARTWPRRVNFCPYCGTPQTADVARGDGAAHRVAPAAQGAPAAALPAAAAGAAGIRLGKAGREDAATPPGAGPGQGAAAPDVTPAAAATATTAGAGAAAAVTGPQARASDAPVPPVPPSSTAQPAASPAPPRPGIRATVARRAPAAQDGAPPKRQPVRLRWWLLALALLWVIWLVANPAKRRIEKQMDRAIALATACKPREAQGELIALRSTKATPEQLQKVQQALNDAAGACKRQRQRDAAWREARASVESALASSSFERARTRLRAFTKRWGEDDASRALKKKIDARQPEHPRADEVL